MVTFGKLLEDPAVLRSIGEEARARAFAVGSPVCYGSTGPNPGIIFEYPDGRTEFRPIARLPYPADDDTAETACAAA